MAAPQNIGMPDNQDVGPTYMLRVTALDPSTGNATANVNVTSVVIDATAVGLNVGDLAHGQWFLVPGPQA